MSAFVKRSICRTHFLFCVLCGFLWLAFPAFAHNPDTSYTKIKISPGQIDFKFTFDVITLFKITNLDENQDHQVTREELLKKSPLIEEFIRQHIKVDFDEEPVDLGRSDPPVFSENLRAVEEKDYHQELVHFVFHREVATVPEVISIVYKLFDTLGDRHTNLASIEEGKDSIDEIVFTQFEPDYDYYTNTQVDLQAELLRFVGLGMRHIFFGFDHILFLLALIVVSRLGEMVKIITAFTVAHSITLILAALGILRLPPRLVDVGVAATIMYVAAENILRKGGGHRWRLTFAFGLVHGLGFATVLQAMGLPSNGVVRSLVSFNVGVEIGQLIIVLVLLPWIIWLGRQPFEQKVKTAVSLAIFLCGLAWFIERASGWKFMPF